MEDKVFEVDNDICVKIAKIGAETLIDEDCCTCINIILKNDGRIATSFLGCHNKYIIKELQRAQNQYFKKLKKTLKQELKNQNKTSEYKVEEIKEEKISEENQVKETKENNNKPQTKNKTKKSDSK